MYMHLERLKKDKENQRSHSLKTKDNTSSLQLMKFGTAPRFQDTFTSKTGLTGIVLSGDSSAKNALAEERKKLAVEHSWDGITLKKIAIDEIWVNANFSGKAGAAGQTGKSGEAIWLSSGDANAQLGYGAKVSGVVHQYKPKRVLTVAVLTDFMQVFAPDDREWVRLFPNIDGAWTDHGLGRSELAIFDQSNLIYLGTNAINQ